MPLQEITIKVDVPEGFEPTGEFRQIQEGDWALNEAGGVWPYRKFACNYRKIIFRRTEPDAVTLARKVLNPDTQCYRFGNMTDLARSIIAKHEEQSK